MLADMESLPEADRQRMSAMMEQLQIRDRFNSLCFLSPSLCHIYSFSVFQDLEFMYTVYCMSLCVLMN